VDATGELISGSITANEAEMTFGSNSAAGGITLSGQLTSAANTTWGLNVGAQSSSTPGLKAITVTLANAAGNNNYAGDTIINGLTGQVAVLTIGASQQQIPYGAAAGNVNVGAFGQLNLNGYSQQMNGLIGAAGAVRDRPQRRHAHGGQQQRHRRLQHLRRRDQRNRLRA
jgi:hypothetical protein